MTEQYLDRSDLYFLKNTNELLIFVLPLVNL